MTAIQRTIGTVELVEQILLNLPYIDLIRCLRVSKHIHEVITNSKALRNSLWWDIDVGEDSAPSLKAREELEVTEDYQVVHPHLQLLLDDLSTDSVAVVQSRTKISVYYKGAFKDLLMLLKREQFPSSANMTPVSRPSIPYEVYAQIDAACSGCHQNANFKTICGRPVGIKAITLQNVINFLHDALELADDKHKKYMNPCELLGEDRRILDLSLEIYLRSGCLVQNTRNNRS